MKAFVKNILILFLVVPLLLSAVLVFMQLNADENDGRVATRQPAVPAPPVRRESHVFKAVDPYQPDELDSIKAAYRDDVADMLNRMASTIETCNRGIYMPLHHNENKANPEFSVRCGNLAQREKATIYYFTWMDIANKKPPYLKTGISYSDAARLCRAKAYALAKFPDRAHLSDIVFNDNQDTTAVLLGRLNAQNALGQTVIHDVRCEFIDNALSRFSID